MSDILAAYEQQYLRVNGELPCILRLEEGFRVMVDGIAIDFTLNGLQKATEMLAGRRPVQPGDEEDE